MTQPWNTMFYGETWPWMTMNDPSCCSWEGAFLGIVPRQYACRRGCSLPRDLSGPLWVNFTTGLWNALGFIPSRKKHLATVSFNPAELLVDGGGYRPGVYGRVSCTNFPSPLVPSLHLWWFGPQKHHLPLTRKDSQPLTNNCLQDFSPFKSFHETKFTVTSKKVSTETTTVAYQNTMHTKNFKQPPKLSANKSHQPKRHADIGTPRLKHLNNLVQATEDSIHLIHPIIDFFILTWACWCHRSTWPYKMWRWCSFCLFNAKGSSSNRNGMVNLKSWDGLREVVSWVFFLFLTWMVIQKMQMNCSIQYANIRTGQQTEMMNHLNNDFWKLGLETTPAKPSAPR